MFLKDSIIGLTIIGINVLFFGLGYLLGRNKNVDTTQKPKSFFSEERSNNNNISINEKKFVVDIKTDGLEKKYDTLGDTKQTKENISESVNKLKSMKG